MQVAKHHYFPLRLISLSQNLKRLSAGMINRLTQTSTAQIHFSYEYAYKHRFQSLRLGL